MAAEKFKTGSFQTFSDLVNYALKDDQIQEILVLLDICGTFQVSSAECEHESSVMNLIKSEFSHLIWDKLSTIVRYINTGQQTKRGRKSCQQWSKRSCLLLQCTVSK